MASTSTNGTTEHVSESDSKSKSKSTCGDGSILLSLDWQPADVEGDQPVAREGQCACVAGNDIYIFGGISLDNDETVEHNDLWRFSTTDGKWTCLAVTGERPVPRCAASLAAVDGRLYLFGGLNRTAGWLNDLFVFDTETGSWREEQPSGSAPCARDKHSCAVIGRQIWFFGGFGPLTAGPLDLEDEEDAPSDEDELGQFEAEQTAAQFGWFDDLFVLDTDSCTWSQPMQLSMGKPTARCAAAMVAVGESLVIFGGRDAEGRLNDVHRFDTKTRAWSKSRSYSGTPPPPRSYHAAVALPDRPQLLVCGGRSVDNKHYGDAHLLDLDSGEWRGVASPGLTPRGNHSLLVVRDRLFLFSGSAGFNDAYQQCDTFYNDLLTSALPAPLDPGCSAKKLRKVD